MACITISATKSLKARMEKFPWVNWSEVGREEANKREIFERYLDDGRLSEADIDFCERIDWHPVDELPIRKDYLENLDSISKGPHTRMTLKEVDKLMGL